MTKRPNKKTNQPVREVHDEPGAEGRFMRGIRKALHTPPRKHADEPKRGRKSKQSKRT